MPPLSRGHAFPVLIMENFVSSSQKDCVGRVKCVLVGDGAVGKTSLVVSYTTNGYPIEYVPTAFDNYNVMVTVDEKPIRLQLCDTAGQDDFDSLRPLCYPGTDVFLLCFSVVSPTSFHNIAEKWLPEIKHHSPSAPIVLVGTQCDLRSDVKILIELAQYQEQPVSEDAAKELAQKIGAVYLESSALTQKNLKDVFDAAILAVIQRNEELKKLTIGRSKGKSVVAETSEANENCTEDKEVSSTPGLSVDDKKQKKGCWRKLLCLS